MPCPLLTGEYCQNWTFQEKYQKQTFCLTSDNYTKCPNWRSNSANCPYFDGTYCKGKGGAGTAQYGSQRLDYCLNSANCTRCANFG